MEGTVHLNILGYTQLPEAGSSGLNLPMENLFEDNANVAEDNVIMDTPDWHPHIGPISNARGNSLYSFFG